MLPAWGFREERPLRLDAAPDRENMTYCMSLQPAVVCHVEFRTQNGVRCRRRQHESAKIVSLNKNRFAGSTTVNAPAAPAKPKLLDQVRQAIRSRHYSNRTEKAYVHWIKRFIFFHNKRHPSEMGRKRDCAISFKPRQPIACERLHAEPGIERYFVSLPRRVA